MDILGSLILFCIFIIAYIIIVEVFTVLFRLTGLTEEKAKFQVISMLTNSGFTTAESEIVVASKKRRKLARLTIIFGYSFTVIIVSIIVNVFLALNKTEIKSLVFSAIFLAGLFAAVLILTRLGSVKAAFDRKIEQLGNRLMFGKSSNPIVLIDTYGNKVMAEVSLSNLPQELHGIPLIDSKLKEHYSIQVLLIKRNGQAIDVIDGSTVLLEDDIVILFGDYKNIRQLFENPETPASRH